MELHIKKVYGPYLNRKTNRKHVIVFYSDGSKRTLQFSRHLMEQHLGRKLDPKAETVDHVNGDFTDDRFENLRIVPNGRHQSEDHIRVKMVEVDCVWCGETTKKRAMDLDGNSKKGKAGPFCSHKCAGRYSRSVQLGRIRRLPPQPRVTVEEREYYKVKKAK